MECFRVWIAIEVVVMPVAVMAVSMVAMAMVVMTMAVMVAMERGLYNAFRIGVV